MTFVLMHATFVSSLYDLWFYYPPEMSSFKYCCLGVFRKEYFRLVTKQCK